MKKEEAIQILADLIDSPFLHTWEKQNKALHMAIEALHREEAESRNINKTDAAEILQKYVFDDEECIAQDMKDYNKALKMAIEALKADWIPCSERLPNTTEQVLISVCDDHGDKPYHYTCVGWKCEECWISDNDYVFGDVIAWMPLPKPYKGGDRE